MAKEGGLGMTLTVDDAAGSPQVLSNDFSQVAISTPRAAQDITGLDKAAMERQLLLADASWTLTAPAFDDAANKSHAVLKTVPSTSVARTSAAAISGQTLSCELLYTDYSLQRSAAGELTFTAPGVLADGTVPTWS